MVVVIAGLMTFIVIAFFAFRLIAKWLDRKDGRVRQRVGTERIEMPTLPGEQQPTNLLAMVSDSGFSRGIAGGPRVDALVRFADWPLK